MQHLPNLISDLALILGAAACVSLVFRKLKQPVVLGYIMAGLLVGPHIKLFPTIVETDSIRIWADIGVIFLLFGLGLEFSFKKLLAVGPVALVTALIELSFTMLLGYSIGRALSWNTMDSLFLGGILSIASTTIIIKAFDELGVKTQKFTGIVTGILIIEDLAAVVLMVILSTLSISRTFEGAEMLGSVFKLSFFLVLWFVSGIFFLPTLLKRLQRFLNDESLLIVSLALCFVMVMLANSAGFSSALGAFIMGSILAETTKAEKIDHLLKPVKDLFGAIFFVSVGMLLDPAMIGQHYIPVLLAVLVLLFGKPLFVIIGSLISGQPLKIAVQSGMSLSQIGEFSFIIATLGLSLNVTSEFLYPVAVTVSVITTFTTPFMIRLSPLVSGKLETILPVSWNKKLNRYSVGAQNVSEESDWKKLIRFYFINIIIFSVVIITVILLSTSYLLPVFSKYSIAREITALLTLIILAPFLWALAFRRTQREAYAKVWSEPLQRGPLIALIFSRIILMLVYIGFLFDRLYSPAIAAIGVVSTLVVLAVFYRRIKNFYGKIELRFLSNLNEREETQSVNQELAPWDTHLSSFVLEPESSYAGKTLQESKIREEFGVNIAIIERGDLFINVPSRDERLYPHDVLSVIGSDDQLKKFREHLESSKTGGGIMAQKQSVSLQHFVVQKNSILLGKTIRHSGIREKTKGLVVGIERKGQHILNPESDFEFEMNDVVWVVGNEKRILVLSREQVKHV